MGMLYPINCMQADLAVVCIIFVYIHIGVGFGVVSALYIERRHFLFVTYLIISRYRKT